MVVDNSLPFSSSVIAVVKSVWPWLVSSSSSFSSRDDPEKVFVAGNKFSDLPSPLFVFSVFRLFRET